MAEDRRTEHPGEAVSDPADPRAPMASAPMKYFEDGSVNWGDMWDTYCVLALDGGPPHRGSLLTADRQQDATSPRYQAVLAEIIRGVKAVSGLSASAGPPGLVAIETGHAGTAHWLVNAILEENVEARRDGSLILMPCSASFTIKGEIKNVITAVAKTTHYYVEHLPAEAKQASTAAARMEDTVRRVKGLFGRLVR